MQLKKVRQLEKAESIKTAKTKTITIKNPELLLKHKMHIKQLLNGIDFLDLHTCEYFLSHPGKYIAQFLKTYNFKMPESQCVVRWAQPLLAKLSCSQK